MNAGAMGGWIFDLVSSGAAKLDGSIVEAKAEDLTVGYRHCLELENSIAIDVVMQSKAFGQRKRICGHLLMFTNRAPKRATS